MNVTVVDWPWLDVWFRLQKSVGFHLNFLNSEKLKIINKKTWDKSIKTKGVLKSMSTPLKKNFFYSIKLEKNILKKSSWLDHQVKSYSALNASDPQTDHYPIIL